jgi:radical SAM enzyme (TIGR01210 family)
VQVRHALERMPRMERSWLKLYNAGSFFDPRAIPPQDLAAVARLAGPFERLIVECHPALVGRRCLEFREQLGDVRLEVAMGLETVHPEVLSRLNKRMTLELFRRAADLLREHGTDLRVFILVRPPWLSEAEGLEWAKRSLDFGFECGAAVCSLIPTRGGNGAMEALAAAGEYAPPSLATLEAALEYGLSLRAGRVLADLWDLDRLPACPRCFLARRARLREMNRAQAIAAPVACDCAA